jgi:hypothetical protein
LALLFGTPENDCARSMRNYLQLQETKIWVSLRGFAHTEEMGAGGVN